MHSQLTIYFLFFLFGMVKQEDITGLIPISRCSDNMHTTMYFACKLDDCGQWISFTKCPPDQVSTGELNMLHKSLHCRGKLDGNDSKNNGTLSLFSKSLCTDSFYQEEIFWCSHEYCWFSFSGCDENETETGYINFNTKRLDCQPKETIMGSTPKVTDATFSSANQFDKFNQAAVVHCSPYPLLLMSIIIPYNMNWARIAL
uniref:Chitin-binding type-2 domain-containing protein n=1 Tax=Biomphalaria glabrata TaxID=6526 RepID=A0A2C9LYB2_BIOGL